MVFQLSTLKVRKEGREGEKNVENILRDTVVVKSHIYHRRLTISPLAQYSSSLLAVLYRHGTMDTRSFYALCDVWPDGHCERISWNTFRKGTV